MLHDPEEELPPSDKKALTLFVRAGKALGVNVELIQRKDYSKLAEYDALFIRETTRIGHHTFRFAKKADSEGMVVIDDPDSILRCTNKVYLAELLAAHKVPRPKTLVLRRENLMDAAAQIGYPVVLKIPEGSFSRGVFKAADRAELDPHRRPAVPGVGPDPGPGVSLYPLRLAHRRPRAQALLCLQIPDEPRPLADRQA